MTDFELTTADKLSSLWLRLRAHLEDRLNTARRRNDNLLPEVETAALRGEIRALTRIIALGDDRPLLMTGDDEQPPDWAAALKEMTHG